MGKFGHLWARVGKGGRVRIGQTDRAIDVWYIQWVGVRMSAGLGLGLGGCGKVWAYMVKGGQRWASLDRAD